jgi:hypothetical protein
MIAQAGPVRFVVEPYDGTLPRLQYNQNSWAKVLGSSAPFSYYSLHFRIRFSVPGVVFKKILVLVQKDRMIVT